MNVTDHGPAEASATDDGLTSAGPLPESLSASADVSSQAALGLLQSDRLFLLGLCCLIVVLTLIHLVRLSRTGAPVFEVSRLPVTAERFRININEANWVEWTQLPEIGESLARQIVTDRESRGPFESIEDLRRVKGIGPATLEKIRPFLNEVNR